VLGNPIATISDGDRNSLYFRISVAMGANKGTIRGTRVLEDVPQEFAYAILNSSQTLRILFQMKESRDITNYCGNLVMPNYLAYG
jgi:hypothetical protein